MRAKKSKYKHISVLTDIVNIMPEPVFVLDNKKKVLSHNLLASKLLGIDRKGLQGKTLSDISPSFSCKEINRLIKNKCIEDKVILKNKRTILIELRLVRQKIGGNFYYFVFVKDVTNRKRASSKKDKYIKELESNTQKLDALFKNVDVLLWSVRENEEGELYYEEVNEAFASVTGRTTKDYNGKLLKPLGSEEDYRAIMRALNKAYEDKIYTYERQIEHRSKLKNFIIRLISVPVPGKIKYFIGSATDITELKEANEKIRQSLLEKEILLKEVYHRVKNNLQVVNSLLHIQSKAIKDPAVLEVFRESQDRVRMMSLIHEKLYNSKDLLHINFSEYIQSLTDYLRQAYPLVSKNIDVKIDSQKVFLGVDKAIPCGLIINEVMSNAYKYAFKDRKNGEIRISFSALDKGKFKLTIGDNGVGFPEDVDFRSSKSMGMVLINTLTEQIEGTVNLDRTGGTKYTIEF
jgi:PAS domain S-box-containing protein